MSLVGKEQIVRELSEKFAHITRSELGEIYDNILDTFYDSLLDEKVVRLNGIGTIKVVEKAGRNYYNPNTCETVAVPDRKGLKFKPSVVILRELR